MSTGLIKKTGVSLAVIAQLATFAFADDVTDTVGEAMASYKNGDYKAATDNLAYAETLIRQKRGESLKQYLPKALAGWTSEEPTVETAAAAFIGGGTTVSAEYIKDESNVRIELIADSSVLQAAGMMFSNPMFATSDGGKLIRMKHQKAIIKYDKEGQFGEVKMMVENRYMITVTCNNVSEADLMAYAEAIDTDKLAKQP